MDFFYNLNKKLTSIQDKPDAKPLNEAAEKKADKKPADKKPAKGAESMRFEIAYTLKNGTKKTKRMSGKSEKAVKSYFKFKYRHDIDSIKKVTDSGHTEEVKEDNSFKKTTHGFQTTQGNVTKHTRKYDDSQDKDDDEAAEKSDTPKKRGRPTGPKKAEKTPTAGSYKYTGKMINGKPELKKGWKRDKTGKVVRVKEGEAMETKSRPVKAGGPVSKDRAAKLNSFKLKTGAEHDADAKKKTAPVKKVKEAETTAAPKETTSKGGIQYGKGIYDSLNKQVDSLLTESMNFSINSNQDENGQTTQSITVTATDEDATRLAELLNLAGMPGQTQQPVAQQPALQAACDRCASNPCACPIAEVDDNAPANGPSPTYGKEESYAGGLNKPKVQLNPNADQVFNPLAAPKIGSNSTNMGPGAMKESKDDLGMKLYKELQQFKFKE